MIPLDKFGALADEMKKKEGVSFLIIMGDKNKGQVMCWLGGSADTLQVALFGALAANTALRDGLRQTISMMDKIDGFNATALVINETVQ